MTALSSILLSSNRFSVYWCFLKSPCIVLIIISSYFSEHQIKLFSYLLVVLHIPLQIIFKFESLNSGPDEEFILNLTFFCHHLQKYFHLMTALLFWESFTRNYFVLNREQLKYLIFRYRSCLLTVSKSSALSCHHELGKFAILHETVMCLVEGLQRHPDLFNDRLNSDFSREVFKLNHLRDQPLICYPVLLLVALPSTLHDVIGLI